MAEKKRKRENEEDLEDSSTPKKRVKDDQIYNLFFEGTEVNKLGNVPEKIARCILGDMGKIFQSVSGRKGSSAFDIQKKEDAVDYSELREEEKIEEEEEAAAAEEEDDDEEEQKERQTSSSSSSLSFLGSQPKPSLSGLSLITPKKSSLFSTTTRQDNYDDEDDDDNDDDDDDDGGDDDDEKISSRDQPLKISATTSAQQPLAFQPNQTQTDAVFKVPAITGPPKKRQDQPPVGKKAKAKMTSSVSASTLTFQPPSAASSSSAHLSVTVVLPSPAVGPKKRGPKPQKNKNQPLPPAGIAPNQAPTLVITPTPSGRKPKGEAKKLKQMQKEKESGEEEDEEVEEEEVFLNPHKNKVLRITPEDLRKANQAFYLTPELKRVASSIRGENTAIFKYTEFLPTRRKKRKQVKFRESPTADPIRLQINDLSFFESCIYRVRADIPGSRWILKRPITPGLIDGSPSREAIADTDAKENTIPFSYQNECEGEAEPLVLDPISKNNESQEPLGNPSHLHLVDLFNWESLVRFHQDEKYGEELELEECQRDQQQEALLSSPSLAQHQENKSSSSMIDEDYSELTDLLEEVLESGDRSSLSASIVSDTAKVTRSPIMAKESDEWRKINPLNPLVEAGEWLSSIMWDDRDRTHGFSESDHSTHPIVIDLNDRDLLLEQSEIRTLQGSPTESKSRKIPLSPDDDGAEMLDDGVREDGLICIKQEDTRKRAIIISDSDLQDIGLFNLSLNSFYSSTRVSSETKKRVIRLETVHSAPALKLALVRSHLSSNDLRFFHRPRLSNIPADGQTVIKVTTRDSRSHKVRKDGASFKHKSELSAREGPVILMEYTEEFPLVVQNIGMASKLVNYLQGSDQMISINDEWGENIFLDDTDDPANTPFLANIRKCTRVTSFENKLFKAPVARHKVPTTDFLLVRSKDLKKYSVREINSIFCVGQIQPLKEIPAPNSRSANTFIKNRLKAYIYRLFRKKKNEQKRVRIVDICTAFPSHSEPSIRKRLKDCADYKRGGDDSGWWTVKKEFLLPKEEDLRKLVEPEDVCMYESMQFGVQRLQDQGIHMTSHILVSQVLEIRNLDQRFRKAARILEQELILTPWNLSSNFLEARKKTIMLQLTGFGDLPGRRDFISFAKQQPPKQSLKKKRERRAAEQQQKTAVTGTSADLRKLSLEQSRDILLKFGMAEEDIKNMPRWKRIDQVRLLSSKAAAAGGENDHSRFARGTSRYNAQQQMVQYNDQIQRIFERQLKMISGSNNCPKGKRDIATLKRAAESSSASGGIGHSTNGFGQQTPNRNNKFSSREHDDSDGDSSEDDGDEDEDEDDDISSDTSDDEEEDDDDDDDDEDEDEEDHEDERNVGEGNSILKPLSPQSKKRNATLSSPPPEIKWLKRTTFTHKGDTITEEIEIIKDPAEIDRIKQQMSWVSDVKRNRLQLSAENEQKKTEIKKEKRRVQERLRRLKKNQQKSIQLGDDGEEVTHNSVINLTCSSCGAQGHIKTNKSCPRYRERERAESPSTSRIILSPTNLSSSGGSLISIKQVHGSPPSSFSPNMGQSGPLVSSFPPAFIPLEQPPNGGDGLVMSEQTEPPPLFIPSLISSPSSLGLPSAHMHSQMVALGSNSPSNTKSASGQQVKIVEGKLRISSSLLSTVEADAKKSKSILRLSKKELEVQAAPNSSSKSHRHHHHHQHQHQHQQHRKSDNHEEEEEVVNRKGTRRSQRDQAHAIVSLNSLIERGMKEISKREISREFRRPVDRKLYPKYYDFIKCPMDLSTMTKKAKESLYQSLDDFVADFDLMVSNCFQFNGQGIFFDNATQLKKIMSEFLEKNKEVVSSIEVKLFNSGSFLSLSSSTSSSIPASPSSSVNPAAASINEEEAAVDVDVDLQEPKTPLPPSDLAIIASATDPLTKATAAVAATSTSSPISVIARTTATTTTAATTTDHISDDGEEIDIM